MEIINVIESNKGIIDSVESFVAQDIEIQKEMIEKAEKHFTDRIRSYITEYNWEPDQDIEEVIETALDDSCWDGYGGYSIVLTWSNVNI